MAISYTITVTIEEVVSEKRHATNGYLRPTEIMERISTYLESHEAPVSKARLEQVIRGKTDSRRNALCILQAEGYVRETVARQAHFQESLRPYRQHQDPLSDCYIPGYENSDDTTGVHTQPTTDGARRI